MRILDEQLWDLKHEEWTVTLQIRQGMGFEFVEKFLLQSSQKEGGDAFWVYDGVHLGLEDLGMAD